MIGRAAVAPIEVELAGAVLRVVSGTDGELLTTKSVDFRKGAHGLVALAAEVLGVDPQRYFTDLLTRLVNGWPNSRIDELMPWCWAADDTR